MNRFNDAIAVISGGADGLGKGIAHRIAQEGGRVILLDINAKLLSKTIADFSAQGLNML